MKFAGKDLHRGDLAAGGVALGFLLVSTLPEIVMVSVNPARFDLANFSVRVLVGVLISLIAGYLFRSANKLGEAAEGSLSKLEGLHAAHDYYLQQRELIEQTRNYGGLVQKLLNESVAEQHLMIARVTDTRYLLWLEEAVASCQHYFTIQRRPPSWFSNRDGEGRLFLQTLRDKPMISKIRIFVVDSEEEMIEELADEQVMGFYWSNTGRDVKTFWITKQKLRRFLGARHLDFPDMVLCDNELLFRYEHEYLLLRFHVIEKRPRDELLKELMNIIAALDR